MIDYSYIQVFKALADETRFKILQEIAQNEEICVCKLIEKFEIAQSKLSYHLKLLLEAGLINVKPRGKWNFYRIDIENFIKLTTSKIICHRRSYYH